MSLSTTVYFKTALVMLGFLDSVPKHQVQMPPWSIWYLIEEK